MKSWVRLKTRPQHLVKKKESTALGGFSATPPIFTRVGANGTDPAWRASNFRASKWHVSETDEIWGGKKEV